MGYWRALERASRMSASPSKTGHDQSRHQCPLRARSGHANFAMDVAACPIKPDVVLSQLANITQDLGTLSCRARNQVMRGLLSP